MKKIFSKTGFKNKAVYIALCAAVVAVSAATIVGYRVAVGSLVQDILPSQDGKTNIPPLDSSEVDVILGGVPKQDPPVTQAPAVDITEQLETLFYKQAVVFPVQGDIKTEFSWGELVKAAGNVWKTHDGIDIAAPEGTKVKAMTSGTVTKVYKDPLWGNCVVIDHGNTTTGYYYGLGNDVAVSVGTSLNSGDVIGSVGNSADIESDLGPHLHFALKRETAWIDPVTYIEPYK